MMLFNVTVLKQSIQNILVFDILIDLILLLLVYLRFYSSISDRLSFYFKQHKHLFKPSYDCFFCISRYSGVRRIFLVDAKLILS